MQKNSKMQNDFECMVIIEIIRTNLLPDTVAAALDLNFLPVNPQIEIIIPRWDNKKEPSNLHGATIPQLPEVMDN